MSDTGVRSPCWCVSFPSLQRGFIRASRPCAIYYYAPYEKTIYRKLREKYSGVCSAADLEALFNAAETVDLYTDVVRKSTEWPTRDYSLKTLARYLGFNWKDTGPLRRLVHRVVPPLDRNRRPIDPPAHSHLQRGRLPSHPRPPRRPPATAQKHRAPLKRQQLRGRMQVLDQIFPRPAIRLLKPKAFQPNIREPLS